MYKEIWKYKKLALINIAYAFVNAILFAFTMLSLMFIYNSMEGIFYFKTNSTIIEVIIWVALTLVTVIVLAITSAISEYQSQKLEEYVCCNLRFKIINRINLLNYQLINNQQENINSMLSNDINQLAKLYYSNFTNFFNLGFLSSLIIVIFFVLNWILALTILILISINLLVVKLSQNYSEKISKKFNQKTEEYSDVTKNILEGINTLFFVNKIQLLSSLFLKNPNRVIKKTNIDFSKKSEATHLSIRIVSQVFQLLVLFICAIILINKNVLINSNYNFIGYNNITSIGVLLAIASLGNNLFNSSSNFIKLYNSYNLAKPIYKKLNELKVSEDNRNIFDFNEFNFKIKNIDYKIENKQIFKDFNLTLQTNNNYAFVGNSGCGKSTLARLICGLLPISNGEIYLNDNEINTYQTNSILNKVGYIEPIPFILNDTVKNNITLYDNNFDETKYNNILELLDLKSIDNNLVIDEVENDLSVGQKQRINFARYLYKDCKLFILDEATSNVDNKTASLIESYLLNNKEITLINITHHLNKESYKKYDQIIDLNQ
ncbi:ABC transporter ATP-binding protein [Malacoplasma penetrans]|uniref:ABC transporter ATP-binding protein n=1 Tax=Malacoplasma penetrans (strain HF-2) TaxID=272633 RepID=Q8EWI5_MALP2|nr:ABC transporter ATP-binding protein [Malacoplasma penetrans]RXY96236.1 ABC transporter ATP-binding protein [Malacoplasma penetrans]BAC44011.1 ABC transporter ATP-binding protein [Malacoplasma penetrans HF-2]